MIALALALSLFPVSSGFEPSEEQVRAFLASNSGNARAETHGMNGMHSPDEPPSLPGGPHPAWFAVGAVLCDLVSTEVGLHQGLEEGNNLVAKRSVRWGLNGLFLFGALRRIHKDQARCSHPSVHKSKKRLNQCRGNLPAWLAVGATRSSMCAWNFYQIGSN